jgi:hypothetical protein
MLRCVGLGPVGTDGCLRAIGEQIPVCERRTPQTSGVGALRKTCTGLRVRVIAGLGRCQYQYKERGAMPTTSIHWLTLATSGKMLRSALPAQQNLDVSVAKQDRITRFESGGLGSRTLLPLTG